MQIAQTKVAPPLESLESMAMLGGINSKASRLQPLGHNAEVARPQGAKSAIVRIAGWTLRFVREVERGSPVV